MGIGRLILGSKKVYERILTMIVFTGAIVLLTFTLTVKGKCQTRFLP